MLYYPAPGRTVRDPRTRAPVGAAGIEVGPNDFDLARQVAWGDLVPEPPEPEQPAVDLGGAASAAPVGLGVTSAGLGQSATAAPEAPEAV